jgi:hypothetical protein
VIHIPPLKLISDALKKIYWWFKSKLFWKPVLASHRSWLKRTGIGSKWELIGEDIEYSQSLARWPEGPEQSKIAFRTKNGRMFSSVTLVIETVGGRYVHDGTKILKDVVYNTYFFAKSAQWRYEKEWRDISQSSGVFSASFRVTGVYFGLRCDKAVITSVVKLMSHDRSVNLYQIYPLDDSFRLRRRCVDRDEIEACGIRSSAFLDFKDVFLPD